MKSVFPKFLILIVALSGSAFAQSARSLDGFLDLVWGTPIVEAKKTLLNRPGVTFKESRPGMLVFSGGSLAGHPTNTIILKFADGRLYSGEAFLAPAGHREAVHEAIKKELVQKYGVPKTTGKDGLSRWAFPSGTSHPNAETLELALTAKHNEVRVSYINDTLAKGLEGSKKEL